MGRRRGRAAKGKGGEGEGRREVFSTIHDKLVSATKRIGILACDPLHAVATGRKIDSL